MTLRIMALAAAAGLLASGAAYAQASSPQASPGEAPGASPPASGQAEDASGYDARTPSGSAADPAPAAPAQSLGDPAQWKAGAPGIVSNAPVPDTPQNRATFGQPDSRTGQLTKPAGN